MLVMQCVLITLVANSFRTKRQRCRVLALSDSIRPDRNTMASMSYSFALIYKSEDNLAPTLNTITLPISLLSGIILPLVLAPIWLQDVAKINPFSYAVNASRALFAGNFYSVDIGEGFGIITLLAIVMFLWSLRSLKKIES